MPPAAADAPRDKGRQASTPSLPRLPHAGRVGAARALHHRLADARSASARSGDEHYLLAKASYAAVAHAIARFEPVLMLARPGEGGVARSYLRQRHRGRRDAHRRLLAARQRADLRDAPRRHARDAPTSSSTRGARSTCPTTTTRPSAARLAEHFGVRALRRPDGPRGGRHHRRRRGHADHHRELPAASFAQPRADQGRDDAGPQGLPRRGQGHLAHLGARARRGPRHRRSRRRRRRVRGSGPRAAPHGARPAAPGLREPGREPAPAGDDRRARPRDRGRRVRPAQPRRCSSATRRSSRPTSTRTSRTAR